MQKQVLFPGPAGQIEGFLAVPDGDGPFPAVVVCHPHPQYGGSSDNNVVASICGGAFRNGIATLRFNFRGVGASAGGFDGGNGEQQDVVAALNFLAAHPQIDAQRIGLAGYSFGAGVSARAASGREGLKALMLVSLPVRATEGMLTDAAMPKLFMVGSDDHIVAADKLNEFAAGLTPAPQIIVVPNSDHFWGGFERQIVEAAGEFFASNL